MIPIQCLTCTTFIDSTVGWVTRTVSDSTVTTTVPFDQQWQEITIFSGAIKTNFSYIEPPKHARPAEPRYRLLQLPRAQRMPRPQARACRRDVRRWKRRRFIQLLKAGAAT